MLLEAICFLVAIVLAYCIYDCWKPAGFPPGPPWLPLVGCFPVFKKLKEEYGYTYLAVQEIVKTYGPVIGLKLGNQTIAVVSTPELIKKTILQDEFNGRPDGFFFRIRTFGGRKGVLFTEGNQWYQCRKFTLKYLRSFGFGQSYMAKSLAMEAEDLIDHITELSKLGAVPMKGLFDIGTINVLWWMIAGRRFEYHDEKAKEILSVANDAFRATDNFGGLLTQMPFLRFVVPEWSGYNTLMKILHKLWGFAEEEISRHEQNLSAVATDQEPQDLIEAYLLEMHARGSKDEFFDRDNLLTLCMDLFLAGSKTTSDTLECLFTLLSLNPKWIPILQNELDSVTGGTRPPRLDDAASLPIMEAIIAETHRISVLAPFGVPHRVTKDSTINGYKIPKDTLVLFNFYSADRDEKSFECPEEFRPERYLDEEGKFISKNTDTPFGIGKRRCLGEALARPNLFMQLAYIIHYFDFELSLDHGKPDINGADGFTISPKPFYLKFSRRR